MRIRRASRAIGAASFVLAATAVLSGCADDPKDKAFGGLGDVDDLPTAPSGPSIPSPGSSSTPGLSSGGYSSGSTSGSSDLPTPSSPPTYNPSAIGEVDGSRCRYSRSLGQMSYDVEIQNASTDQAFQYSITVTFKVGSSPDSSIATRTIGTRFKTLTVSPGGTRTATVDVSHSTNDRMVYSCQVTSATKSPTSS
ncbi:hypothetical protein ITI46_30070 [Streptomyces oryzae]|uniref:Ig-like domain-containing protein n=1 Tax=Streptomyces oryzae TaxID=1434886 RepID=A0ABS3XKL7_9ACTN|nr:hypothetical protein [Streptomyces oryzae]MBO8195864.1 hypothetical protein [Streptomyces oryzae]